MYTSFNQYKKGLRIIERNSFSLLSDILRGEKDLVNLLPPLIRRAKGPYIYDYDENRFVDFFLADGSLLLGHAPMGITKILKNWLGRGYSSGYHAESHALLAKKLFHAFLDRDLTRDLKYRWFFYNSTPVALFSLFSLLRISGYSEQGVYISGEEQPDWLLYPAYVKRISTLSINRKEISSLGFVIIKFRKSTDWEETTHYLRQLWEEGVLIISDETQLESYLHSINNRNLNQYIHIRVFGDWIASGISFGCILADKTIFERLKAKINKHTFAKLLPILGFPPLYKVKAALASSGLVIKFGGARGLIQKNREFYSLLENRYFHFIHNIIYMKECTSLSANYAKLYKVLLQNGIYFPFSPMKPVWISNSHTHDLLQRSAEKINLLFDSFYR